MDIIYMSPQTLRRAADLQEKIQEMQGELNQLLGATAEMVASAPAQTIATPKNGRRKKRVLSPEAISNIRAGVQKRMAKKGRKPVAEAGEKPKRKMSPAGRRAISLAAKARWAKARAEGKSRL